MRKTVLITGSSRGLGKKLALVFASHNYNIILHARTKEHLKEVKEEILSKGADYFIVTGDLRRDSTINKLAEVIKEKNSSVLINNAAIVRSGFPLAQLSFDRIEETIKTNLVAPIKLCQKIYPIFKKRKGTIININTLVGLGIKKFRSLHSASKWGLRGFTNSLGLEAKDDNIRVISVYLSKVKTRPTDDFGMDPTKVAERIYEFYKSDKGKYQGLIIDGRPKKNRIDISEKIFIVDGRKYELKTK
jgi:3-oxoacyl-[acyl-carrier protein] reductase